MGKGMKPTLLTEELLVDAELWDLLVRYECSFGQGEGGHMVVDHAERLPKFVLAELDRRSIDTIYRLPQPKPAPQPQARPRAPARKLQIPRPAAFEDGPMAAAAPGFDDGTVAALKAERRREKQQAKEQREAEEAKRELGERYPMGHVSIAPISHPMCSTIRRAGVECHLPPEALRALEAMVHQKPVDPDVATYDRWCVEQARERPDLAQREARNTLARERYRTDSAYRERQLAQHRERYRIRHPGMKPRYKAAADATQRG